MTHLSKLILPLSLFLLMFFIAACGGDNSANTIIVGGGADSPQEAVEQFLSAAYDGEVERAISFVCNTQREPMRLLYADMTAAYAALREYDVDLSGLSYEITEEDVDTAKLAITGDVRVTTGDEARLINVDERFRVVNLRLEDELWRVC